MALNRHLDKANTPKLTPKQRAFCNEYIIDWNATRAAIKAGYSEKTARTIGAENLAKPYIKQYIEEIQKDIEKIAGVSRLQVLQEHMKIAFSSVALLHNSWIERKEFDKLTCDQKSCIAEISTQIRKVEIQGTDAFTEVEFVKIKLFDKQRALDSISKMLGYESPQKLDHTSLGEKINTSDTEVKDMLKDALKIIKRSG